MEYYYNSKITEGYQSNFHSIQKENKMLNQKQEAEKERKTESKRKMVPGFSSSPKALHAGKMTEILKF